MPDLNWNLSTWASSYDWSQMGEEWSSAWGSSETQWFATLYPRIHTFLPAQSILEIAPGCGRWTKFLLPLSNKFRAIDLSETCVQTCKAIFKNAHPDCEFHVNDGMSLDSVANHQYDFIFSFDSLVHASLDVLDTYVQQIINNLLNQNGVCFLHHSSLKDSLASNETTIEEHTHYRDPNVSAADIAHIVDKYNGQILLQEVLNWNQKPLCDAITIFCRKNSNWQQQRSKKIIENRNFDKEVSYAKEVFENYRFSKR